MMRGLMEIDSLYLSWTRCCEGLYKLNAESRFLRVDGDSQGTASQERDATVKTLWDTHNNRRRKTRETETLMGVTDTENQAGSVAALLRGDEHLVLGEDDDGVLNLLQLCL